MLFQYAKIFFDKNKFWNHLEFITLQLNASHNRLSFLTRWSFPTQETLRSADFSYNQIPVLTTDFTHFLKKLQHLDFSHNAINEIRDGMKYHAKHYNATYIKCWLKFPAGVIENLTSIVSLDLSYNELPTIANSARFSLPKNLTYLKLSNNYLSKLPIPAIVKQKDKLKLLDVRDNQLPLFSHELMKLVENGTTVLYSGTNSKAK